ncbi:LysR family transcriptional regulator [Longirhabdus pacifica]|uniref:LysR family transcriptional regulator n=1 Tax=Longirhabdus pacifica TaxID=2305227 RepID=UPI00100937AD|nr:LysR family transcriptional regulator [Longirhabdus pacifica]
MDIDIYRTFIEVVKWKNYSKAAEQLGYAQSSVTTQMKKLETYYEAKMFERIGGKMQLTYAGENLYTYALNIVGLENEAKQRIRHTDECSGSLSIGTVESLATFELIKYFKHFNHEYPRVTFSVESNLCKYLYEGVRHGTYDLAIVMDEYRPHDKDLIKINMRKEEMVLVACMDHPLCNYDTVKMADLQGETFVFAEKDCSYRTIFEKALKNNGVHYSKSLEFNSIEAIKECVKAGLGISLLPKITVVRELNENQLACVPVEEANMEVFSQIVIHNKKWISPIVERFIQLLVPDFNIKDTAISDLLH